MVQGLSFLFDGLRRPIVLILVLIVGAGVMSMDSHGGASGSACAGLTDNATLNRTLCRLHPKRLLNTPVADLIPGLSGH